MPTETRPREQNSAVHDQVCTCACDQESHRDGCVVLACPAGASSFTRSRFSGEDRHCKLQAHNLLLHFHHDECLCIL